MLPCGPTPAYLSFQTNWSVENDEACKELVRSARGQLYGYDNATSPPIHWASMAGKKTHIDVEHPPNNLQSMSTSRVLLVQDLIGVFLPHALTISVFSKDHRTLAHCIRGTQLILRNCTPNTDGPSGIESIASRQWDILCMKMCEDHDCEYLSASSTAIQC